MICIVYKDFLTTLNIGILPSHSHLVNLLSGNDNLKLFFIVLDCLQRFYISDWDINFFIIFRRAFVLMRYRNACLRLFVLPRFYHNGDHLGH